MIVHLAAVAHANQANKSPYSTFDHSLRTLENALDCVRLRTHCHFIYFSSSVVYGNFEDGFVTEDSVCKPLGNYGALKLAGEKLVIAYNQVFQLPYTIVRPSALYGERCVSRRVGQIFIENALQGLDLEIAGDGSDRRDFTYVQDVVNGVVRMIEDPNSKNQIFNLTFGHSRSIDEMVRILRSHFPGIRVKYTPRDKFVPSRGFLSLTRSRAARRGEFVDLWTDWHFSVARGRGPFLCGRTNRSDRLRSRRSSGLPNPANCRDSMAAQVASSWAARW